MTIKLAFYLIADVSSDAPSQLRTVLETFVQGSVVALDDGYHVEGTVMGESARELNRELLTALRKVERRTRLRSTWTVAGVTERYFDYVPKGSRPAQ
ncbi:MAG: hypothetical protein WB801_10465 [Candidatus Dormiibacterota bacterium]